MITGAVRAPYVPLDQRADRPPPRSLGRDGGVLPVAVRDHRADRSDRRRVLPARPTATTRRSRLVQDYLSPGPGGPYRRAHTDPASRGGGRRSTSSGGGWASAPARALEHGSRRARQPTWQPSKSSGTRRPRPQKFNLAAALPAGGQHAPQARPARLPGQPQRAAEVRLPGRLGRAAHQLRLRQGRRREPRPDPRPLPGDLRVRAGRHDRRRGQAVDLARHLPPPGPRSGGVPVPRVQALWRLPARHRRRRPRLPALRRGRPGSAAEADDPGVRVRCRPRTGEARPATTAAILERRGPRACRSPRGAGRTRSRSPGGSIAVDVGPRGRLIAVADGPVSDGLLGLRLVRPRSRPSSAPAEAARSTTTC